uniref:Replication termination factor 2 n=1 Tax=Panagrolaimus sp. JU765 TaxID=591449 RepID=A0AC34QMC7_9BILA
MGADGGTIPKRCELVKTKKKEEKIEKSVTNAVKWKTCQLSGEPLKKPVVACKLGRLYNKEAIIEAKLSKSLSKNPVTKHIRALSDVKELKLTENRDFKDNGPTKGDVYKDVNSTLFICPITGLNMNGTYNFLVNWECGCVFSEKAMQEVKSDHCYGCDGNLDKSKVFQLNPEGEVLKQYEEKVAAEIAAKKSSKSCKTEETVVTEEKQGTKRKAESSSIQDDPNVSKALKSIYTTSEEAKNQPKAHWVTHNPLYF